MVETPGKPTNSCRWAGSPVDSMTAHLLRALVSGASSGYFTLFGPMFGGLAVLLPAVLFGLIVLPSFVRPTNRAHGRW